MPFTCQGGPPCTSGGIKTVIADNAMMNVQNLKGRKPSILEAKYSELTRVVVSYDEADIFIILDKKNVLKYERMAATPLTTPISFSYYLDEYSAELLENYIGKIIEIETIFYYWQGMEFVSKSQMIKYKLC
ncbi:MAG: hypothetical protein ABI844_17350 [Saprospiraceae bacterium]